MVFPLVLLQVKAVGSVAFSAAVAALSVSISSPSGEGGGRS